jgi:hypothetical protein
MGEQHERKAGPSLPPSPLTPMREAVPLSRFSLPWRTVLFALLAGPVAAAVVGLAFAALYQHALPVAFGVSIVMAWRGLLLGIGAALGDRVASSWPRTARWSLGMGVSGLVPGLELLGYAVVFRSPAYMVGANCLGRRVWHGRPVEGVSCRRGELAGLSCLRCCAVGPGDVRPNLPRGPSAAGPDRVEHDPRSVPAWACAGLGSADRLAEIGSGRRGTTRRRRRRAVVSVTVRLSCGPEPP